MNHSRRSFIGATFAAIASAGVSKLAAQPTDGMVTGTPQLKTFSDWIQADVETRRHALE
jgi:hypothetical protein